ncbi:MAG: hypothetical protein II059_12480 [Clostridia bacterium]|nr:hypothetical protein [Clostridia bacterium]
MKNSKYTITLFLSVLLCLVLLYGCASSEKAPTTYSDSKASAQSRPDTSEADASSS